LNISTEKTNLKVRVKNSYFKGSFYLIETDFEGETVFFNHKSSLKNGEKVYLKIEEKG
jgi:hypothetical protein